jgi:hypothetical protein
MTDFKQTAAKSLMHTLRIFTYGHVNCTGISTLILIWNSSNPGTQAQLEIVTEIIN